MAKMQVPSHVVDPSGPSIRWQRDKIPRSPDPDLEWPRLACNIKVWPK